LNASQGTTVTADYKYFGLDASAGRFAADIAPVDINGDGYIDVLYAVDTRGNIWRINTSNPADSFKGYVNGVADWPAPVKVATVTDWTTLSERRKFMYAPSVVVLGTQTLILVGTGDREKPSAGSNAASVNNRFYGIRDNVTLPSVTPVVGYGTAAVGTHLPDLVNVTNQTTVDKVAMASRKGWFMDLSSSSPMEQVVTTPLTIAGTTYFNTYQAKPASNSANSCSNLGTARAYKVDFETGIGKPNVSNQTGPETFLSPGIPPSPVGGLVSVDGKTYPFCIGCSGPTVLTPTNPLVPVRPNRKPVYRYERVDK
jgi:type IV pilus assembly protein PilY1